MPAPLSDYLTAQKAFNDRDEAATAKIATAAEGITADVAALNATIKQLQDSQGQVTPEDQALIDKLQAQGAALRTKQEAQAAALAALDESTAPVPPPPVPPPPPPPTV